MIYKFYFGLIAYLTLIVAENETFDNTTLHYIEAEFDRVYNGTTHTDNDLTIYRYKTLKDDIVRVWLSCDEAREIKPLFASVRHRFGLTAMQIPVISKPYSYSTSAHTLCPYTREYELSSYQFPIGERINLTASHIDVEVSAYSQIDYKLNVTRLNAIDVKGNNSVTLSASPSQPSYVRAWLPSDVNSVVVRVHSNDDLCAMVSVQPPECPIHDSITDIKEARAFQTMSTQSAMPIMITEEYDHVYVILLVLNDDHSCNPKSLIPIDHSSPTTGINRTKWFTVFLETKISYKDYIFAMSAALVLFAIFWIVAISGACVLESRDAHDYKVWATEITEQHSIYNRRIEQGNEYTEHTSSNRNINSGVTSPSLIQRNSYGATDSINARRQVDDVCFRGSGGRHNLERRITNQWKKVVTVADLSQKSYRERDRKYRLYIWNLLTLSAFYALPVVQLVFIWANQVYNGDQDLCWFNHLCARPVWHFYAFNSVFSNCGYILLGLLFVVIVGNKHTRYNRLCLHNRELIPPLDQYGLPRHFGVYYAIGVAIIMEGVMSASYHICPSPLNYQFDTAYMYIIGTLGMIQIYSQRHPDTNANAHVTYGLMAAIIMAAMTGVYFKTPIFWVLFSFFYAILIVCVSIEFYYKGSWTIARDAGNTFERFRREIIHDDESSVSSEDDCNPASHIIDVNADDSRSTSPASLSNMGNQRQRNCCYCCVKLKRKIMRLCSMVLPSYPKRFFIVLIGMTINFLLLAYGLTNQPTAFPSYLLTVFIVNFFLYFVQYFGSKLVNKEKLSIVVASLLCLSILIWAASLVFFFQNASDWSLSPASSRALNQRCILLNFYDSHDLWHFLSSISLFLSFSCLLKLDDDLGTTPRHEIVAIDDSLSCISSV